MPRLHRGLFGVLLGAGLCVAVPQVFTQAPDRTEPEVPQVWTKPDPRARENLGAATRSRSAGVVLLGDPKIGPYGTAWVLSSRHRLLVTNAHVADLLGLSGKMLGIVNGTAQVHKVERIWYHPGVRRKMSGGKTSIRAECPADGEVDGECPDLAVIQLASGGPELPAEFPMAGPEELKKLFAQTVGMLGFPGHSTTSWPAVGEKAQGTYHDGVVSRLTNFGYNANAPEEDLQFVQTTLGNYPGFSGSPIYLSNGHVVAVNNMVRLEESKGVRAQISHGVRIDCLWELLVHHGLDSKVSVPVEKSRLRIDRWMKLGEGEKRFRQAMRLVCDAADLIDTREEFLAGVKKCEEAIEIAPSYPHAYRVRCAGLNRYFSDEQPSKRRAREMLDLAGRDAQRYIELMPSDLRGITALVNTANNQAALMQSSAGLKPSLTILNKVLGSENVPRAQRAEFHSLRGVCHFNLRNRTSARADFNESVRLDPENDVLYENRARFWTALGESERAADDRARARAIRKKMLEKILEKEKKKD